MELHILIGLNVCSQPVVPRFLFADMMLRYFIKQFQDMFVKALSVRMYVPYYLVRTYVHTVLH